ncbi:flagellar basal body L-ring protein FlgH [Gilvimarinus agarilyticus]|uniref:flagellar basal body L-ring protein FlgH n=1 Tax=unclassified Gilvimarinus TaxID=2642066 RepID=UPI001C0A3340|nr:MULTISPECIES: flagellar basal body L-ring protein FlgH [unclassified Gilvimarinus]MBU2887254.1 flagellar basal body L-ring protein FlgH [Gilvimarinus agarilyticus]MDO6571913.1 flagellar basal body L-ring protein FlgH [Gilvimarinus sp. 2_MG-2023]MDO6745982.1 flagellar basal body L-ring protein FlgH [Gilvimarinus sp. 1_MG-2023]
MKRLWVVIVSVGAAFLTGCVTGPKPQPGDPYYAPVVTTRAHEPMNTSGSLYQSKQGMTLFTDTKARNIGDIITINLTERTVSSKSAGVNVTKASSTSLPGGTLLGMTPTLNGNLLDTDISQDRDFEGDTGADQSNSLSGSIAVTVADVLPNGNLVVRGEKWMTLNRGDEFIRVSGILRPEDITTQNTVDSTRLANAQISYSGTGELASSQNMGWLSKFFNSAYWPF